MAYTLTYSGLVDELKRFTEDDASEFLASLPGIIQRAQDRVQRGLDLDWSRETLIHHLPFNARQLVLAAPNALAVRSIMLSDSGEFVLRRSADFCRAYTGTGTPRFFYEPTPGAIYVSPTPNQNYAAEVEYLARLPALSTTAPTNWVSLNAADLLLLAALIEAEQFLAAPERVTEFSQMLTAKMGEARDELRNLMRSDAPTRVATNPIGGR